MTVAAVARRAVPDQPLHAERGRAHQNEQAHVQQQLRRRPSGGAQVWYASARPSAAAAGMVVTEMNTPMRALARDRVSDTTPTMAASTATMTEKRFGESIRLATGRMPCWYASGVCPDHRIATPKITAAA